MTKQLHPSERRILDIVSSEGPIEARRVAELYGAKQNHVTLRLRILRDRGLVVPTSRGRGATWAISEVGRRIQVERAQASADAIAKQQARNDREIDEWANQGMGGVVVEQEAWAFTGRILPQKPFSVFTVGRRKVRLPSNAGATGATMSILDNVKFTAVPPPPEPGDLPFVTHEGELHIVGHRLRCYRISDGRAIIHQDDFHAFFGAMGDEPASKVPVQAMRSL